VPSPPSTPSSSFRLRALQVRRLGWSSGLQTWKPHTGQNTPYNNKVLNKAPHTGSSTPPIVDTEECTENCKEESCHPAHTTLEQRDGRHVRIDHVAVGEYIATPHGYEPILGFLHRSSDATANYYRFITANGALEISDHHWLVVNGTLADPATVTPGDLLTTSPDPNPKAGTNPNPATVTPGDLLTMSADTSKASIAPDQTPVLAMEMHMRRGAYHLFTPSGLYYADGLLVSDYNDAVPQIAWRLFVRGYVSLRYALGLPVIPEGEGVLLRPFAFHDALKRSAAPPLIQHLLSPLTITSAVVLEVGNLALTSAMALRGSLQGV